MEDPRYIPENTRDFGLVCYQEIAVMGDRRDMIGDFCGLTSPFYRDCAEHAAMRKYRDIDLGPGGCFTVNLS